MSVIRGLVAAVCAGLMPLLALAEMPLVQGFAPFPRADLRAHSPAAPADYTVYLSAPQRISGQLRADRTVQAEGSLQRLSWQIPAGHSADEAFLHAEQQWLDQGYSLLYACKGRRCGASNLIANSVLDNARLYGPDDGQRFAVLRGSLDGRDRVLVLYSITRGNRRVYLHMDEFFPAQPLGVLAPDAGTLLLQLKELGSVNLAQWPAEPQQPWLGALQNTLRRDFVLRLTVQGPGAQAWYDALLAEGVSPTRLELDEAGAPTLMLRRSGQ